MASYEWDVLYNGSSIRDQIQTFNVSSSKGMFCREMTLDIYEPTFQNNFDWTQILTTPSIEIKVKSGGIWYSLGKFFLEKPVININIDGTVIPGLWGRSKTAILSNPFSQAVNRFWDTDTTFQTVIDSLLSETGITASYEIGDIPVYAYTFASDKESKIETIRRLAEYAGCYLSSDGDSTLYIRQDKFEPTSSIKTLSDNDIQNIITEVEYPEFGNRIKIAPTSGSNMSINLSYIGDGNCLPVGCDVKGKYVAVVTDKDGNFVEDGVIVEWSEETGNVTLNPTTSSTGDLILEDDYEASSWNKVSVDFPIQTVIGVWAKSDRSKNTNLYLTKGGSFSGSNISFEDSLLYCDQKLVVKYSVGGAAQTLVCSETIGDYEIKATIEGVSDTEDLYVGNVCKCGSKIQTDVIPSSSVCYTIPAYILVVVELLQRPGSGTVNFRLEGCGFLASDSKKLGVVNILNEEQGVDNIIENTSQVEVKHFIDTTRSYSISEIDSEGNIIRSVSISSVSGKTFILSNYYADGTVFKINYWAKGACTIMWMNGDIPEDIDVSSTCRATIYMTVDDGSEEGLTDSITVSSKECRVPEEDSWSTVDDDDLDDDTFDNDNDENDDSVGSGRCCQLGQFGEYVWTVTEDCFSCSGLSMSACLDRGRKYGCTWGNLYSEDGTYRCWCPESPVDSVGSVSCTQAALAGSNDVDSQVGEGGLTADDSDSIRFGISTVDDCPPECTCSQICNAELANYGRLQSDSQTIANYLVSQGFESGSPEYQTAYEAERQNRYDSCISECEAHQNTICSTLVLSGPDTMVQEEMAYFSDNWGNRGTISVTSIGDHSSCPDTITLISTDESSGYLMQAGANSGGSYEVTVTYPDGSTDSVGVRISDNGGWAITDSCHIKICPSCSIIVGAYKYGIHYCETNCPVGVFYCGCPDSNACNSLPYDCIPDSYDCELGKKVRWTQYIWGC